MHGAVNMTKKAELLLKKQPIIIGDDSIPETPKDRLKRLKQYLADEMAEKYPCAEYVSDLNMSIERIQASL
jgi:hypothetical protein